MPDPYREYRLEQDRNTEGPVLLPEYQGGQFMTRGVRAAETTRVEGERRLCLMFTKAAP